MQDPTFSQALRAVRAETRRGIEGGGVRLDRGGKRECFGLGMQLVQQTSDYIHLLT